MAAGAGQCNQLATGRDAGTLDSLGHTVDTRAGRLGGSAEYSPSVSPVKVAACQPRERWAAGLDGRPDHGAYCRHQAAIRLTVVSHTRESFACWSALPEMQARCLGLSGHAFSTTKYTPCLLSAGLWYVPVRRLGASRRSSHWLIGSLAGSWASS